MNPPELRARKINSTLIAKQLWPIYLGYPPGLPDFHGPYIPKREKYTKWLQTISNRHKLYQMVIKYMYNIYHSKALQNLPKYGIFGLKTNHLATLLSTAEWMHLKLGIGMEM
jgi:hypothetical protein